MDTHYFEHSGRRWRLSDPAIPAPLRAELVRELMAARRMVSAAKRKVDSALEREARARVHDAKVALGERGPRYWEPLDTAAQTTRATASMRALLRSRAPDKTICPSDVARVVGQPNFRKLMPLVRKVAIELAERGEVVIMQRGQVVNGRTAKGPVRIALRSK